MTVAPFLALVAVVAYLVGAVPFGYLVARAKGVDILSGTECAVAAFLFFVAFGWFLSNIARLHEK